jgi:hypothetical protein
VAVEVEMKAAVVLEMAQQEALAVDRLIKELVLLVLQIKDTQVGTEELVAHQIMVAVVGVVLDK